MNSTRPNRSARRLALAAMAGGMATILGATAASAAPFATQASAQALYVGVLDPAVVIDTGTETAQNDGSEDSVTASEEPLLTVLDGQDVVTAGALGEVAVANNDGTSAACAGVVGEGGSVDVGDPLDCGIPGTDPVEIQLADVVGTVTASIEADAITATCPGAADGTVTGDAVLTNAQLVVSAPPLVNVEVDLATDVDPNTNALDALSPTVAALLSPLVEVTLNEQVPLDPEESGDGYYGGLSVTAISVDALDGGLADVDLGTVTCGPSADLALVPAVPLAGLPIALGTLAVAGGGAALVTRRRQRPTS
jgi:hypothetical protein